jgi:ankyrin repeat protein
MGNYQYTTLAVISILKQSDISISYTRGYCPLHVIIERDGIEDEIQRYLILHDRGAISKPTRDGSLALHLACKYWLPFEDIKLIYNKYPQAMLEMDDNGDTPIGLCLDEDTKLFFIDQIQWQSYAYEEGQYQDHDDVLPIFRYLKESEVHVGTVELMIDSHPQSLVSRDILDGDYLIHHACKYGHLQVINYLLEKSYHGVATRSGEGKLPIELLLCANVDRHSSEYVEALYRLLRANPSEYTNIS